MRMGFIERNETDDIRERVLEGIAKIERDHELNKRSIDEIVEEIAQFNVLSDSLVTIVGEVSTSYAYFKHICKRASVEKLEELTEHSNYVVQCYAFAALTQKAPDKLFKIIKSKLHITKKINTIYFDILGRVKVADFFIYEGLPFLTAEQYNNIVEEVFEHNYDLDFISNYFNDLEPEEEHYNRVKKYVLEFYKPYALLALAKFQKNSDLEIIKSFSHEESWEFYGAVKIFPHPSFWNILIGIQQKGLGNKEFYPANLEALYAAISTYHNNEAKELLTNTFDKIENPNFVKYHAEAIFRAVKDFKGGFYDKLLFKLWKDYNQINLEIFDYLLEKYSNTTRELIFLSLSDPNKLYKLLSNIYNFKDRIHGHKKLAEKMIRIFIKEDEKGAFNAIKKNIIIQDVNYLPIFTKIVSDLLEDEFIEVLFERFSYDKNYHVFCEIANCLLNYNSPEVNSRLLKIVENKSYLRKNWELKEILKKLNLV
ncbi:MAG: hypothetical protein ACFE9S_14460 [Candidatus Hermodarchaeota archaeon]